MSTLAGQSVLVTGGGTGIGRACAARVATDGAAVMICGRTESRLRETVDLVSSTSQAEIRHVVADVTSDDDVRRAVAAAAESTGSLNGVVANAGGGGSIAPLHLQDPAEFERVLNLNVLGTFLLVKHAIPRMVDAGGGSFVGMSSVAGHLTHRWFGAYPVAKAGIEALMRNAADEYGAAGVRFNAVQPGFTTTEIMEGIPRDSSVFESYLRNTPMAGVAEPVAVAVADVVRFLIGPESRWVTGQMIAVDGGHHLRAGPDFSPFTGLGERERLGLPPGG